VNYLGWKYHVRGDWTASRLYTLSERSTKVLDGLQKPIQVTVFMSQGDPLYQPVEELLKRYSAASSEIHVDTVDPERNVAAAQSIVNKYKLTRGNVVVFERGSDRRIVQSSDLADYDYSGMQFGQGPKMKGFKGEQMFTGAILDLTEAHKPKVLFTTGHGEASLDDASSAGMGQIEDLLGKDNFDISEWASLGKASVPPSTDLVVIAGPTARFTAAELKLFTRYLQNGGRMLVMLDPLLGAGGEQTQSTGLESWLANYGVKVDDDVVVDPQNRVPFFGAESFFVNSFGDHPVTDVLRQAKYPVILTLARSVRPAKESPDYTVKTLLKTGSKGWGETNLAHLRAVDRDDADVPGPVSLAVSVEPKKSVDESTPGASPATESKAGPDNQKAGASQAAETGDGGAVKSQTSGGSSMRLIVVGDSDFATNGQLGNAGNPTLMVNAVNWMVARKNLLGIPPRPPEQVHLSLTRQQLAFIFWLVIAGLPGLAVGLGVIVYVRRRR
jgi:ABC-type uncharacterized transport system involved in gliding motility auxiliary subunit